MRAVRVLSMAVLVARASRFMKIAMRMPGAVMRVGMAMRVLMAVRVAVRMGMHEIAMPVLVIVSMRVLMSMAVIMLMGVRMIMLMAVGASLIWVVHRILLG